MNEEKLEATHVLSESLKLPHDLSDEFGIMEERWWYSERVRKLSILDEYPKKELSLLFEVQPRFEVNDVWRTLNLPNGEPRPRLAILVHHHEVLNIPAGQNRYKQPMFVNVVQNVYGPNGVIPSLVRAYLIQDEVAEFRAEAIDRGLFSSLLKPTFKFCDLFSDRKLSPFIHDGRNKIPRHVVPRIVESAIKVVDNISQSDSEIVKCRSICQIMYKSVCSEFRVFSTLEVLLF